MCRDDRRQGRGNELEALPVHVGGPDQLGLSIVNLSTCIGAVYFLIGAYLLLPEMASHTDLAAAEQRSTTGGDHIGG